MTSSFIEESISEFLAEYGAVPPPWFVFPDSHPCDIGWRIGGKGEFHMDVWGTWWDRQKYDEDERIRYFRRWPPPPRWLDWMINAIWDLIPPSENEEAFYAPFFQRVEELDFGTREEFDKDLNDPQWLEKSRL